MTALFVILLTALVLALSWGISVGIIYLVCLCFSWSFDLLIATGIWLVLTLVGPFFKSTGRK